MRKGGLEVSPEPLSGRAILARIVISVLAVFLLTAATEAGHLYVSSIHGINFTKPCRPIDATHSRCDGVILTHSPMATYSKSKPEPEKLTCTPKQ